MIHDHVLYIVLYFREYFRESATTRMTRTCTVALDFGGASLAPRTKLLVAPAQTPVGVTRRCRARLAAHPGRSVTAAASGIGLAERQAEARASLTRGLEAIGLEVCADSTFCAEFINSGGRKHGLCEVIERVAYAHYDCTRRAAPPDSRAGSATRGNRAAFDPRPRC